MLLCTISEMRQDRKAHSRILTPDATGYAAAGADLDFKVPRTAPAAGATQSPHPCGEAQLGQNLGLMSIGKR
jgi:hypothetical protein